MVVSCPVDLVKIKLQVQTDVRLAKNYQGPFDVLKKVYHAEGLKGCYRGLTIQSFRCRTLTFMSILNLVKIHCTK